MASGQETYFCWEQCYPPNTSSSNGSIEINAGDTILNFTAHVVPNGNEGVSEARFLFSNEDLVDDTISVKLVFDVKEPSGIIKPNTANSIVKVASNSINNFINIHVLSFLPQLSISVYSIAGQLVSSQNFNMVKGIINVPVASLPNGIYTVQLTSESFYYNQKVVISR